MIEALYSKTKYNSATGCIEWVAKLTKDGYGLFRRKIAHRVACEISGIRISKGKEVNHLCNNRKCINIQHLEVVTHKQNMSYSKIQNRQHPGSLNGCARLTEKQILDIRNLYSQGLTQQQLGVKFNITQTQVNNIVNRKQWTYV